MRWQAHHHPTRLTRAVQILHVLPLNRTRGYHASQSMSSIRGLIDGYHCVFFFKVIIHSAYKFYYYGLNGLLIGNLL